MTLIGDVNGRPRRRSTEAAIRARSAPRNRACMSAFLQKVIRIFHAGSDRFWKCHVAVPASTASIAGSRSIAMDRLRTNPLAPASIAANSAFFSSWMLRDQLQLREKTPDSAN